MAKGNVARKVLITEVSRERVRGRPRLGWMEGVKVALSSSEMMVEAELYSALVHMQFIEYNKTIFSLSCVITDHPLTLWWLITRSGVGCHYMMGLE